MMMGPHRHPFHATLNLEGGDDEVVHLRAFGRNLGIEIRIDDTKTGVVITTERGMFREAIPGRRLTMQEATISNCEIVEDDTGTEDKQELEQEERI